MESYSNPHVWVRIARGTDKAAARTQHTGVCYQGLNDGLRPGTRCRALLARRKRPNHDTDALLKRLPQEGKSKEPHQQVQLSPAHIPSSAGALAI